MQAKDLVVMGDARILGQLYVDQIRTTQDAGTSAPRNSKLVPVAEASTNIPTTEGEIYWYYGN